MARQSPAELRRSSSTSEGFTFSRSNRFLSCSQSPGFYEINRTLNKRGTIFGTEKRPDLFTRKEILSPGPSHYSPTHLNNSKGKIVYQAKVGERNKLSEDHSPGPGTYKIKRDVEGPKFTFQKKYKKKDPEVTPSGANYNPNFTTVRKNQYASISFGYGNKHDPCKGKIKPGPGDYMLPSCFPKVHGHNHKLSRTSSKFLKTSGKDSSLSP